MIFGGVENPGPVAERDIDSFLSQCRAKLDRKLVQHGFDFEIGQMAQIRVHGLASENRNRLAAGTCRAVLARPSIGYLGTGEHAGKCGHAGFDPAAHPSPCRANGLGNVVNAAVFIPAFA